MWAACNTLLYINASLPRKQHAYLFTGFTKKAWSRLWAARLDVQLMVHSRYTKVSAGLSVELQNSRTRWVWIAHSRALANRLDCRRNLYHPITSCTATETVQPITISVWHTLYSRNKHIVRIKPSIWNKTFVYFHVLCMPRLNENEFHTIYTFASGSNLKRTLLICLFNDKTALKSATAS